MSDITQAIYGPQNHFDADSRCFRDWFDGSVVATPSGAPLVTYHGTYNTFTVFERRPAQMRKADGLDSIGSWFTDNHARAADYGPIVMSVYLSIKRPLILESFDELRAYWADAQPRRGSSSLAHKRNPHHGCSNSFRKEWMPIHDGILIQRHGTGEWRDQSAYIAFEASQIQLASPPLTQILLNSSETVSISREDAILSMISREPQPLAPGNQFGRIRFT